MASLFSIVGIFLATELVAPSSVPGGTTSSREPQKSTALPLGAPVHPEFFGMHLHSMGKGNWPGAPAGAVRLWDSGTNWMNVQPAPGRWNIASLDTAVATARARRVPVTLVLGATPRWASSRPNERAYFAPGMAAPPRHASLWRNYVYQIVRRYRGRIQAYEVWNEPNLRSFFSGTPKQLAYLTYIAKQMIKTVDPHAYIVGPAIVERHHNAVAVVGGGL